MPATENQTTLIYEHHQGDNNGERTAYPVGVAEFRKGYRDIFRPSSNADTTGNLFIK
jgi:hypothetical protein